MPGCRAALRRLALLCPFAVAACLPPPDDDGAAPTAETGPPADVAAPQAAMPTTPARSGRPPPRRRDPRPARLIGLDGAGLLALLGEPGFVRRDAPAQIWRYRSETCSLAFFLYADEDGGDAVVSHVEAPAGVGAEACLERLLAGR